MTSLADPVVLAAFGLLVGGLAGSVLPVLPGPLLSLAGVYLFWWGTGFADPGLVVLVALTVAGGLGVVVDLFGAALGARAGGASTATTAVAAVVGVVLLFVAGPVGVVVGVAGTVFAVEFYRNRDAAESLAAAVAATVGVLASAAVQVLLALSILLAMIAVAVL
ncbi:MAG: DUF456 family protein [Salinirussus sp.]